MINHPSNSRTLSVHADFCLTINEFLDYLEDVGHLILKPIKKEDKKQLNYKFVSKLRCLELTNKEKRKLIKEFYEMSIVNDYLNCFMFLIVELNIRVHCCILEK